MLCNEDSVFIMQGSDGGNNKEKENYFPLLVFELFCMDVKIGR